MSYRLFCVVCLCFLPVARGFTVANAQTAQQQLPSTFAFRCATVPAMATYESYGQTVAPTNIMPPADPLQQYRSYWLTKIPIVVGIKKIPGKGTGVNTKGERGGQFTVEIDGPAYWHSLDAGIRAKLTTFGKLQQYCQHHEGARN